MKLTDAEMDFIKSSCGVMKDQEIADKLTILRSHAGEKGKKSRVTVDLVRKARYKLGIRKGHGRGVCKINPLYIPRVNR